MRLRSSVYPAVTCLAVAVAVLPFNDLTAQSSKDVRYTEVTRNEFGGRLGRVMKAFRRGGKPVTETLWYSGPRRRTDSENKTSEVSDAKAGTVMTLEHDPRTYWLWSINDPILVVETIPDTGEKVEPTRRRPKTKYTVKLDTERPGGRETIVGLDAEQVIMTLQVEGETYNEEADSTERSTLVVLSEIWLTPTFPATPAKNTFDSAWAARTARDIDSVEVAQMRKAMEQAYAEEPRLRVAVYRLDSAMAALKGYSLRSFSHYVVVPDGAQFDREKVVRDAEKSLVADLAASAAKSAVSSGRARLGRMAGGRLGALGGGRGGDPKPEQIVIMRSRREITELSTDPIPADKFLPPPGYKRRTPSGK